MPDADVIVIGSGPAGTHAAFPIVAAGKRVIMLDGGYTPQLPDDGPMDNFEDVRRSDRTQYRWFLGDDLSGIPVDGLTGGLGGGQVSGNRAYVIEDTDQLLPLSTHHCQVIQSLAKGGLAAAWGGTCAYLSSDDLTAMGLPPKEIEQHYDIITQRIGISGPPGRKGLQPPVMADHHAQRMLDCYASKKQAFDQMGIIISQPHTALLTQDMDGRKTTSGSDMEYWADPGGSLYRPSHTLAQMECSGSFRYMGKILVKRVEESGGSCTVHATAINDGSRQDISAKVVILAAGAVGSARILLQSLRLYDTPIPFVGKPHVFSACLHPRTFGMAGPKQRTSLCQLLVTDRSHTHGMDAGCAQLYSYRSLLLFRLLSSLPLPAPQALRIAHLLSPSLVIADIRFPGIPSKENVAVLKREDDADRMHISMHLHADERTERLHSWKRIRTALRMLGLFPIRNIWLPEASSSHYSGTIPSVNDPAVLPLSTGSDGRVHRTRNIYVADASTFRMLPSKPHTLTIMANANRIGTKIAGLL